MRGFRALRGRGARYGRPHRCAGPRACARSARSQRVVRARWRDGHAHSKFIEPLFAIDGVAERSRRWIRPRRRRAGNADSRAGRNLLELFLRRFPGRLFVHPELVGGGRDRISGVVDGEDQRVQPRWASFRDGSRQGDAGRHTDHRRLSFHPIRQVPALPGSRDFADLRLGGPGRLCHRDFIPIVRLL